MTNRTPSWSNDDIVKRRQRRKDFSAAAFRAWIQRREWTQAIAAEALGCARNSVINYLRHGAPYYIGLACAAIDHDLDIPPDPGVETEP